MISAGEFKNGLTLEIEGQVCQIMEFQHVKPGKGAAFVRTKLRDIINGGIIEKTFRPTDKFNPAVIERVDMQYLYNDGDMYNFMNNKTFEQIALSSEQVGDAMKFVKENETCRVMFYNGSVFSVEPPQKVTLEVTDTEPGIKGDTQTGAMKPATLETGATVMVPLFIDKGEKIIVSTETGKYESRA